MNKEYLPSKIFIVRVVFIFVILATIFGISKIYTYFKNRSTDGVIKLQIKDVVQKDSNDNGIPDWEESLWGLDPEKDGPLNKDFIIAKRKILAENNDGSSESGNLTENDELSRELFSVVMSLQQSGTLNDDSITLITEAVGEKIDASPLPDIYAKNMLNIVIDSIDNTHNYNIAFGELVIKYADANIGDELVFISEGLKNDDSTAMSIVNTISNSYKSFGEDLMKIPVPASVASTHLSLANNYEKTGQSIDGLSQILENQILGMSSVINYKKYSDALVSDINKLTDSL